MSAGELFSRLEVVDLASFIAGPAAATVLSGFGVDVLKVESPRFGDPSHVRRTLPNPVANVDYALQLTNRDKRGIALDLKRSETELEHITGFPKRPPEATETNIFRVISTGS
jgi:crotonobetainyl-CoA:carnitine CoA-transferase CaiB-like acyl-CoA transferase